MLQNVIGINQALEGKIRGQYYEEESYKGEDNILSFIKSVTKER